MREKLIYLIRHGRPDLPSDGIFYGRTDLPLSSKGMEQASKIAPVLSGLRIDITLSSPLLRCLQTASLAEKNPLIVDDLREIDLGSWEMRSKKEILAEDPQIYKKRGENLAGYRTPGGETFQEVSQRAMEGLRPFLDAPGNIAIFGHAGVFRTLLWRLLEIDLSMTFRIDHNYCGIHVLRRKGKRFDLLHSNWIQSLT